MDTIKLCKMVDAAIKDEEDAVNMYAEMAVYVEDGWNVAVNSIQKDENKHAGMLRIIKGRFCR